MQKSIDSGDETTGWSNAFNKHAYAYKNLFNGYDMDFSMIVIVT